MASFGHSRWTMEQQLCTSRPPYRAPIVSLGWQELSLFYGLSFFIKPLSTAWLIREMFKHRNARISAHIGAYPIPRLAEKQEPAQVNADEIKTQVYSLSEPATCPRNLLTPLQNQNPKASKKTKQCQSLGTAPDGKGLFLTTQTQSPAIVRDSTPAGSRAPVLWARIGI